MQSRVFLMTVNCRRVDCALVGGPGDRPGGTMVPSMLSVDTRPDEYWEDQMSNSPYVLPRVWTWDKDNGGKFANINRPIAGATHERELDRKSTRLNSSHVKI